MENETNILLSELVEAVSRPDWWAIGITAVNAVIVIVLTLWQLCLNKRQTQIQERQNELQAQQVKLQEQQNRQQEQQTKLQEHQNKLQEQQIRQQEYEIYSRLYKLVKKADVEIDEYLNEIISSLGVIPWKRAKDGFLQRKLDYLLELRNELEQNALDFEIKFSKEFFNLGGYRGILATMIHNLQLLVKMVEEDKMHYDYGCSQTIHNVDGSIEKGEVYYIAQHIKDKTYEVAVGSNLLGFVELKKKLREGGNDILEKIRERCKVE